MRQAYEDSVEAAGGSLDGEDEFFGDGSGGISSGPQLLRGRAPEHPLKYESSFNVLRNRRTWDQNVNLHSRLGGLVFANQTKVLLSEDPDVRRQTRNRSTAFELGYRFVPGLTTGLRASASRNSDIIGIRQSNSVERDQDQLSLFANYDRSVLNTPIRANFAFGGIDERQPEFSRRGTDVDFDVNATRTLPGAVTMTAGANLGSSWLASEAPETRPGGDVFESDDRTTDRTGRLTLNWAPLSWLGMDVRGSSRRGLLQRPEEIEIFDFDTFEADTLVVREEVRTQVDDGGLGVRLTLPWGTRFNASGSYTDNQILYDVDSTRTNITLSRSFTMQASDSLWGAGLNASFTNGEVESDYTRRLDGYVQRQWQRRANLQAGKRLNRRTTSRLESSLSVTSRRFLGFRPSGPTSFPPADQDLVRANAALGVDYRPWVQFSTGLEGRVDLNRTINLTRTTSINNVDQVNYAVRWTWSATPLSFWTVSQDNSAGAQQYTYPFAPARDQLSFVYQIGTTSSTQVTRDVRFQMTYNLRFQSAGSFREETASASRLFGKTGGSDQFDLLLLLVYKPMPWVTFEASQQSFVTQNFTLPSGDKRVDSETRRQQLSLRAVANRTIASRWTLGVDLKHNLTADEIVTNTVPPSPPTRRDDALFTGRVSLSTFLDF